MLAVGLVLVYRATRVINFAHGEIGAFGAAVLGQARARPALELLRRPRSSSSSSAPLIGAAHRARSSSAGCSSRRGSCCSSPPSASPSSCSSPRPCCRASTTPAPYPTPLDRARSRSATSCCAASTSWCWPSCRRIVVGARAVPEPHPVRHRHPGRRRQPRRRRAGRHLDAAGVDAGVGARRRARDAHRRARQPARGARSSAFPSRGARARACCCGRWPPRWSAGSCRCRWRWPAASPSASSRRSLFANVPQPRGRRRRCCFVLVLVLVLTAGRRPGAATRTPASSMPPRGPGRRRAVSAGCGGCPPSPRSAACRRRRGRRCRSSFTTVGRTFLFTRDAALRHRRPVGHRSHRLGRPAVAGQFAFVGVGAMTHRRARRPGHAVRAARSSTRPSPACRWRCSSASRRCASGACSSPSRRSPSPSPPAAGSSSPTCSPAARRRSSVPRGGRIGPFDLALAADLLLPVPGRARGRRRRRCRPPAPQRRRPRARRRARQRERGRRRSPSRPRVAKLTAFGVAGGIAALAGALLGRPAGAVRRRRLRRRASRSRSWPWRSSAASARWPGPLLGAVYVVGLPALVRRHASRCGSLTSGVGLLVLLLYLPGGLVQLVCTASATGSLGRRWPGAGRDRRRCRRRASR